MEDESNALARQRKMIEASQNVGLGGPSREKKGAETRKQGRKK